MQRRGAIATSALIFFLDAESFEDASSGQILSSRIYFRLTGGLILHL